MIDKRKETTLLDSSLNTGRKLTQTPYLPNFKTYLYYNIKIIDCKGYKQLYFYPIRKSHKISGFEKDRLQWENDTDLIDKANFKTDKVLSEDQILYRNVMRSKIKLQRIVKANEEEWKTFITLTFKDNITELSKAYNKFRYFVKTIQKYKPNFKWVCVPEFQKNGKVHYHLVSNIDLNDNALIYIQTLDNGESAYHLKHWSKGINKYSNLPIGYGYDSIELCKDREGNDTKKLCGYISKYMTKAYIENCFFNKNRYYLSQNLNLPKVLYLDSSSTSYNNELDTLFSNSSVLYMHDYTDSFGNDITFIELKVENNVI